jgi:hypothetical protein
VLRTAIDWNVIDRLPCTIKLLRTPKAPAGFYDFQEFERLVQASRDDVQTGVVVLLGGEAGLRCAK